MKRVKLRNQTKTIDKKLLSLALILSGIGLVSVADASAPSAISTFSDKYYFLKQQAIWGFIGVILMLLFSRLNYLFWKKISVPFFAFSLITLAVVLLPGLGSNFLGARRWIVVGPVSFQPSELTKLSLAIYLAHIADSKKGALSYLIPLGLVASLIMLQPDLGTTVVLSGIGLAQIFVSGMNIFHFVGLVLSAGLGGFILILTSSYRRDRLLTFLQQTKDPLGKAYHIRQILLALGAGGFWGVGLGQSRQKYLFLPEAATDSIFAVIAEEAGFLGASVIILLFGVFIYRAINIAKSAPDRFSQVLAVGLTAWIGGQAFANIGAMTALLPLTGIPLPFVSYGGSSLTTVLLATGILLNISRHESKKK